MKNPQLKSAMAICLTAVLISSIQAGLITPTGVSFSGSDPGTTEFFPLTNIVNGSGLSGVATESNYTTITHSGASATTAWTTNDPAPGGGDYFVDGPGNPVVTFTLDQEYALTDVVIWGYHFGTANGNELTGFDVAVTGSGGSSMASGLTRAISAANANSTSFGSTLTGNTVTLTLTENGFGTGPAGGDRVGIGEVKFIGTVVPEPGGIALLLVGLCPVFLMRKLRS